MQRDSVQVGVFQAAPVHVRSADFVYPVLQASVHVPRWAVPSHAAKEALFATVGAVEQGLPAQTGGRVLSHDMAEHVTVAEPV